MKPKFEGIDSVYKSKADNKDIRDLLERLVPKAKAQMVEFSQQFKGRTEQETCKKIFDYLKNNFTYVADGEEQIIKLPSALLAKKVGDCKSYSLFTSAILENLGIPYHFVYASYTTNPIPGHVYVTTDKGCIIDAVYGIFNQEKKPNYKYKKNMNVRYMAGTCTDCNTGIGETWVQRQQRLAAEKLKQARGFVKETVDDAGDAARRAAENAKRLADEAARKAREAAEKLKQGGLTVTLAPARNLILLIIKNNLDGFASKLQATNPEPFANRWKDFGGDRTILTKTIKEGASRPEKKLGLLPRIKKLLGSRINGIGEIVIPEEIKAKIIAACTSAGTAIGGPGGAAAGAAAGGIIVGLLPTMINALKRVPNTESDNIVPPTDLPGGGTTPGGNGGGTTPGGNGGGTTPGAGMNMKTILPIVAVVAAGGIYLATRKK
jgi:hypothetical protein